MKKRILILTTKYKAIGEHLYLHLNSFSPHQVEYTIASYDDVYIELTGDAQEVKVRDENILNFDLAYFESWKKDQSVAISLAHFLKSKKKNYIDTALNFVLNGDKVYQMMAMSLQNIPIPKSIYVNDISQTKWDFLQSKLGTPIIMKDISGKEGQFNYLLANQSEFDKCRIANPTIKFIFQEYIPNEFDYRAYVFGDEVVRLVKRQRSSDDTHLNNITTGAKASLVKGEIEIEALAVKVAKLFLREVSGVDIIVSSQDNKPYLIEVNYSPAFLRQHLIDLPVDEKIIEELLHEYLSKRAHLE